MLFTGNWGEEWDRGREEEEAEAATFSASFGVDVEEEGEADVAGRRDDTDNPLFLK